MLLLSTQSCIDSNNAVGSPAGGLKRQGNGAARWKPFIAIRPFALPDRDKIGVDFRLLLFAVAVSIIVGIVMGMLPALRALRLPAFEALPEIGPGLSGGKT